MSMSHSFLLFSSLSHLSLHRPGDPLSFPYRTAVYDGYVVICSCHDPITTIPKICTHSPTGEQLLRPCHRISRRGLLIMSVGWHQQMCPGFPLLGLFTFYYRIPFALEASRISTIVFVQILFRLCLLPLSSLLCFGLLALSGSASHSFNDDYSHCLSAFLISFRPPRFGSALPLCSQAEYEAIIPVWAASTMFSQNDFSSDQYQPE